MTVRGSIAYVSQTAWIQNASIKDNILFGLPFDPERYETVVKVSALEKDLALMSHGELIHTRKRDVLCLFAQGSASFLFTREAAFSYSGRCVINTSSHPHTWFLPQERMWPLDVEQTSRLRRSKESS